MLAHPQSVAHRGHRVLKGPICIISHYVSWNSYETTKIVINYHNIVSKPEFCATVKNGSCQAEPTVTPSYQWVRSGWLEWLHSALATTMAEWDSRSAWHADRLLENIASHWEKISRDMTHPTCGTYSFPFFSITLQIDLCTLEVDTVLIPLLGAICISLLTAPGGNINSASRRHQLRHAGTSLESFLEA